MSNEVENTNSSEKSTGAPSSRPAGENRGNYEGRSPEGRNSEGRNFENRSNAEGGRPGYDRNRGGKRFHSRRKICRFCKNTMTMDYRDAESLRRFVTERGKMLPRRITGTCAKHQRQLAVTIKRARVLALLPFVAK